MSNFFSRRLRDLRGERKQAEFSRFLGVSAPMYNRYEKGVMPRADVLSAIAQRCGVTVESLLSDTPAVPAAEQPPPETCLYPKDCNLPERLVHIEEDLDELKGQMKVLCDLLGGALHAGLEQPAGQKAGGADAEGGQRRKAG